MHSRLLSFFFTVERVLICLLFLTRQLSSACLRGPLFQLGRRANVILTNTQSTHSHCLRAHPLALANLPPTCRPFGQY